MMLSKSFSDRGVHPRLQSVNIYLVAAIVANLFFLLADAHGSDMGYWRAWITQLADKGYAGFQGDYPPVYIHWFWFCSKFVGILGLDLNSNGVVKTLAVIPVMFVHLLFVRIVYHLVSQAGFSESYKALLLWFTALNPVLLTDGPMWGQVDLVPIVMVLIAVLMAGSESRKAWAYPIYVAALLTKFQMIAFAPVFGFLFFRDWKAGLKGALLCLPVIALILLPFWLSGNLLKTLENAYINTLGQYPYATMNAANLWALTIGNLTLDSHVLFGVSESSPWARLFVTKNFGIFLFACLSVTVFAKGIRLILKRSPDAEFSDFTWFSLLVCAIGFFVLLPGMHERYIFSAAAVSIVAVIKMQRLYALSFLINLGALLNIVLVFPFKGHLVWTYLSLFNVLVFAFLLTKYISPCRILKVASSLKGNLRKFLALPELLLLAALIVFYSVWSLQKVDERVVEGEVRLTELSPTSATQSWGRLQIGKTVEKKTIVTFAGRFTYGLGTHADSVIRYRLDDNYEQIRFSYGVSKFANQGVVEFLLEADNEILWRSGRVTSKTKTGEVVVGLRGVKMLTLKVDSLGERYEDHANWLNPVLKKR